MKEKIAILEAPIFLSLGQLTVFGWDFSLLIMTPVRLIICTGEEGFRKLIAKHGKKLDLVF